MSPPKVRFPPSLPKDNYYPALGWAITNARQVFILPVINGHEGSAWGFLSVFIFLWLSPWHMGVPRLGAESEQQLLAYTKATAKPDSSQVCGRHHSLQQCWILNPLSEAGDQTRTLLDTGRILNPLSHSGISCIFLNCT